MDAASGSPSFFRTRSAIGTLPMTALHSEHLRVLTRLLNGAISTSSACQCSLIVPTAAQAPRHGALFCFYSAIGNQDQ
jgi:hypothetical protein